MKYCYSTDGGEQTIPARIKRYADTPGVVVTIIPIGVLMPMMRELAP